MATEIMIVRIALHLFLKLHSPFHGTGYALRVLLVCSAESCGAARYNYLSEVSMLFSARDMGSFEIPPPSTEHLYQALQG